jgi:hypothetical protein
MGCQVSNRVTGDTIGAADETRWPPLLEDAAGKLAPGMHHRRDRYG